MYLSLMREFHYNTFAMRRDALYRPGCTTASSTSLVSARSRRVSGLCGPHSIVMSTPSWRSRLVYCTVIPSVVRSVGGQENERIRLVGSVLFSSELVRFGSYHCPCLVDGRGAILMQTTQRPTRSLHNSIHFIIAGMVRSKVPV